MHQKQATNPSTRIHFLHKSRASVQPENACLRWAQKHTHTHVDIYMWYKRPRSHKNNNIMWLWVTSNVFHHGQWVWPSSCAGMLAAVCDNDGEEKTRTHRTHDLRLMFVRQRHVRLPSSRENSSERELRMTRRTSGERKKGPPVIFGVSLFLNSLRFSTDRRGKIGRWYANDIRKMSSLSLVWLICRKRTSLATLLRAVDFEVGNFSAVPPTSVQKLNAQEGKTFLL